MERGVEHGYLRYVRQDLLDCVNTLEIGGVVQRSQFHALDNHLFNLRCDEHGLVEFLAAMDHTVTDGIDLLEVFDTSDLRVDEFL